jgi:hypothetical protein
MVERVVEEVEVEETVLGIEQKWILARRREK